MITLFAIVLTLISTFLILLVLVQRGRGGGLTGALGGMGGQSAFGTKAGDTFTRVTVITAAVWIVTSVLAVLVADKMSAGPLGNPDALPPATGTDTGAAGTGGVSDFLPPESESTGGITGPGSDASSTSGGAAAESTTGNDDSSSP